MPRKNGGSIRRYGERRRAVLRLRSHQEGLTQRRAIQTRGLKDGAEWVLSGSKLYISGADKADYALIFARTSDDPGLQRSHCVHS